MGTHILNLYEITNPSDLNCDYRLYSIGGYTPQWEEDDHSQKNLNQLLKMIAFRARIPVALARNGDQLCIAIPYEHQLVVLEYPFPPDVIELAPQPERHELKFDNLTADNSGIALSFLQYALRTPLMRENGLWSAGYSYFDKCPINQRDDRREADVYEGFAFRLLRSGSRIFLALRLTYRYVDRRWLPDRCNGGSMDRYRMRHALYHYGNRWFPVQFLGTTGHSIRDQRFVQEGQTDSENVYDWTLSHAGHNAPAWINTLNPDSPAINYRYPGNQKKRFGAAALCKLILPTDDPEIRTLHRVSIKAPDRRLEFTQQILRGRLQNAELNGVPIRISDRPMEARPHLFPIPSQQFGQEQVLAVSSNGAGKGISASDLGRTRLQMLQDPHAGALVDSPFDVQYLLAPTGLPRGVVEDFKRRFEGTVHQFVQTPYRMDLVLYDDRNATTLKRHVDAIIEACDKASITCGFGILILPENARPDLHNYIKRRLGSRLPTQCVSARNLRAFYRQVQKDDRITYLVNSESEGRYRSYLRYTAFGHLIVNRKWLWCLEQPTNYDVYIGIDVLYNTAAFVFLYEGGRKCYIRTRQSEQKEKLSTRQIRQVVYETLNDDLRGLGLHPRSIVIHRDGRAYAAEWKGFTAALQMLQKEGLLAGDLHYGMVEVHKHSALGLRQVYQDRRGHIVNPRIGSWYTWNASEGIVCNTGEPFRLRGTVNPLHLRIAFGSLDVERVLEDAFRLSQLCWMTPDRCCRLPITIKLADDFLRPVAALADDDEAEFGENEIAGDVDDEVLTLNMEASGL